VDRLDVFLSALRPLLVQQGACAAYLFGSHARGTADAGSDIDIIIIAPSRRPPVERFRDYLSAILEAGGRVDLFVYTEEEFERMKAEERPFLVTALDGAKLIHEG
jgi:predicted nucleotidyltransferase